MWKQVLSNISAQFQKLRNRPKIIFSGVVVIASTGLIFWLWNNVNANGSWITVDKSDHVASRMILLEKDNGVIDGSFVSYNPDLAFNVTGFRVNKLVSLKLHSGETEDIIYQGKLKGRYKLLGRLAGVSNNFDFERE